VNLSDWNDARFAKQKRVICSTVEVVHNSHDRSPRTPLDEETQCQRIMTNVASRRVSLRGVCVSRFNNDASSSNRIDGNQSLATNRQSHLVGKTIDQGRK